MKNTSHALKRIASLVLLLAVVTVISGCRNTAEGVGEDMERAGENIQREVD